jgi:hypothetical protein
VQNTCASSWTKARPRIKPCSAPDGSFRWQSPNSASRSGSSRKERTRRRKIWMWPGQLIGFSAKCRSPSASANMAAPNFGQWPLASQSERAKSSGVRTSR